nr:hypothetical protein [Aliamphritea spongicola]
MGDYRSRTGNEQARRDNFADAVDFVGWYTRDTERLTGVSAAMPTVSIWRITKGAVATGGAVITRSSGCWGRR